MPYYDTIEEDLRRAKEILAKGRGEHATEVAALIQGTGTDRENIDFGSGGTIYADDIYAAYKLLESFVAEIERLRVEHTRDVLRYTAKGYQAGENADARHWRERAEAAEAEVARLRT